MPKLKVRNLEWYMDDKPENHSYTKYIKITPVLGVNGYYRFGAQVWYEYNGVAYAIKSINAQQMFDYGLIVNDEAILRETEVKILEQSLKVITSKTIRKSITKRLELHYDAFSLRNSYRNARKLALRFTSEI